MPEEDFLIAREVAELFRTTTGALYSQRHRGENPGALGVQVGARLLWKATEIEAWFQQQQAAAPREIRAVPYDLR